MHLANSCRLEFHLHTEYYLKGYSTFAPDWFNEIAASLSAQCIIDRTLRYICGFFVGLTRKLPPSDQSVPHSIKARPPPRPAGEEGILRKPGESADMA